MRINSLLLVAVVGCHSSTSEQAPDAPAAGSDAAVDATVDAAPSAVPAVAICAPTSDPNTPALAFAPLPNPLPTDAAGFHYASYACAAPCSSTDPLQCTHPAAEAGAAWTYTRPDASTHTKLALELVVDGMGAMIVFTPDGDKTLVLHAGSGGTNTDATPIARYFEATTSAKTAFVIWMTGSSDVFPAGDGWWTRKDANAVDVPTQAKRPSAVIGWIAQHLAAGQPYGTVGCSLGTMATLSPVLWGTLQPSPIYQMSMGGSTFYDVNATCGRPYAPYPTGHCDVDGATCSSTIACAGPATNMCRYPTDTTTTNFAALINYVHGLGPDDSPCFSNNQTMSGPPSTVLAASSFDETVTSWALDHRVDFVTDEGGTPPGAVDEVVMEGSALIVHALVGAAGTPTSWTDYDGRYHCDSFTSVAAWNQPTLDAIQTGMGL